MVGPLKFSISLLRHYTFILFLHQNGHRFFMMRNELNISKLTTDCGKYFVPNCLLLNIQRQLFRAYSG